MPILLQVALGGAIGASLRFLAGAAIARLGAPAFPVAILAVNVVGCFAMGVLAVALARSGQMQVAPFLMTGILGGFTTFSAFGLETLALAEEGRMAHAALYVALSVILSLAAVAGGAALARAA